MKKLIEDIIKELDKNPPPSESVYLSLVKKVDFKIDDDYILFIKEFNGAQGFLSEDTFILFWNIGDIIACNPYYPAIKECDSLFFIGSDGSNIGYAFNKADSNIVAVDFLEITESKPEIIGENFESFLFKLSDK